MKFQRNIRLFNLFSFFSALDFYVPIKIVYFYQVTGSYSTTASIISFVYIAQALFEVPTGIFSDLIGRKKTIVSGAVFAVLAYILYAAGSNYWIFVLGSFIEGAARSLFSGNNNAYLHNLLSNAKKEDEYHHYYGRLNSIMGAAAFPAALASGLLIYWSLSLFMWINLIPQLIALTISLFLVDIKHEEKVDTNIYNHLKEAFLEIKGNINLRYLSLSEMLGGGGMAAYEFQAAIYAAVWPTWAIGIARAIQEGSVLPSFYFAGKIIDKLGMIRVITIGWITSVGGNILAGLSQSIFSPLFVMISLPVYGAADTANQKLLQREFTERQRATIASLNSLGNSITFSIVLYICGIIANHYGPFVGLIATQISVIPSAFFEYKLLQRIRKDQNL